jgi:hypothetical protein
MNTPPKSFTLRDAGGVVVVERENAYSLSVTRSGQETAWCNQTEGVLRVTGGVVSPKLLRRIQAKCDTLSFFGW